MDPTIKNLVRMICGVRMRPLLGQSPGTAVWSFGGVLKIADATHAMDVPVLPRHADHVVLDVIQADTLLERWWIGSDSAINLLTAAAAGAVDGNNSVSPDDSSDASSAVAVTAADIAPTVSLGSLKVVVRCLYMYLIASDAGLRSLNILNSAASAGAAVIGPDTPLTVKLASASVGGTSTAVGASGATNAGALARPTKIQMHTRSERPFCCDWRCDTGSDLGTVTISVRRMFTPMAGLPPTLASAASSSNPVLAQAQKQTSSSDPKQPRSQSPPQQQQQVQHTDPVAPPLSSGTRAPSTSSTATGGELVTPSLRGVTPPESGRPQQPTTTNSSQGGGALGALSTTAAGHNNSDELPPMALPAAQMNSKPTLSGLGRSVSNDSDAGQQQPQHQQQHLQNSSSSGLFLKSPTLAPAPKLTPILGPSGGPGFSLNDAAAEQARKLKEQRTKHLAVEQPQSSAQGSPQQEQQEQQQEQKPQPQQTGLLSPSNAGNSNDLSIGFGNGMMPPRHGSQLAMPRSFSEESLLHIGPEPALRISDDNFGCAISTTSVFHASWCWEQSTGGAMLRPQPSASVAPQLLAGSLGRCSCFEDDLAADSAAAAGGEEDTAFEAAPVLSLLRSLDDLDFVTLQCDVRRSLQVLNSRSSHHQLKCAAESIENTLDMLSAAQDKLLLCQARQKKSDDHRQEQGGVPFCVSSSS